MTEEAPAGDRGLDRLAYFSDAVMAIAITLLALDLPLLQAPTTRSSGGRSG